MLAKGAQWSCRTVGLMRLKGPIRVGIYNWDNAIEQHERFAGHPGDQLPQDVQDRAHRQ